MTTLVAVRPSCFPAGRFRLQPADEDDDREDVAHRVEDRRRVADDRIGVLSLQRGQALPYVAGGSIDDFDPLLHYLTSVGSLSILHQKHQTSHKRGHTLIIAYIS